MDMPQYSVFHNLTWEFSAFGQFSELIKKFLNTKFILKIKVSRRQKSTKNLPAGKELSLSLRRRCYRGEVSYCGRGRRYQKSNQRLNEVFIARSDNNIQLVNTLIFKTLGLVARKPVFGVSDKVSLRPFSAASPVASLHIIHRTKRITKALIRLRECAI